MYLLNRTVFYWKPIFASLIVLIVLCLIHLLFVSPLSGVYLIAYVVILAASTTWATFAGLQTFLQQTKPLDLGKYVNAVNSKGQPPQSGNAAKNVLRLSVDIDEYFVRKWFVYISNDRTFTEESREILEEILKKVINVELGVDHEVVVQGGLNLYLRHLKEFRRGLKRREKYGGKLSDLYRYSHACSTSIKAKEYFIQKLTTDVLNHFISWELSNSLPYQVVASIVARKFTTYMLNLLSNPEFLNFYILTAIASIDTKNKLNLSGYSRVKIIKVTEKGDLTPVKTAPVIDTAPVVIKDEPKVFKKVTLPKAKTIEADISRENVKIHEPKSCKTWYDSMDLDSVTLGQDILDIIGDSDKDNDDKDEMLSPIASAKHLLDEVKHITSLEGFKTSMKPLSDATIHNFKDLQESTVNSVVKPMSHATSNALHRIGGLHLQDEAAGVVEGLLDFGRTKIRKGLRLTGLQDIPSEGIAKPPKKNIPKMSHVRSLEKEDEETAWVNPLQEVPVSRLEERISKIPSITTQDEGSPELEYEETADLATSIAKLRSLLEQKSSESNLSTPSGLSPMPPDELANKLLLESDGDDTDGMMPSFYKFCAKTATGVIHNTLNTIKTALPGNIADCDRFDGAEKWLFVEANSRDCDLSVRMDKLLCERKAFCTVDTAYEAIDSLEVLQATGKFNQPNINFEDELDDFEVKLPVTKVLLDIICELFAESKETSLAQEPVIKTMLLLFGNSIEEIVKNRGKSFVQYWCSNARIPAEANIKTLSLELDEFVTALLAGIPDHLRYVIGEKALKEALELFVSSLQVQVINQDMVLQLMEIICLKLMEGSKLLSPTSAP